MQVLALLLVVVLSAAGAVTAGEEWEEEELGHGSGGEPWKPSTPGSWICYSTAGSEW